MIISASKHTDIPAFYSDWFFNRLKDGFVYFRNPMNARQISRIPLTPEQAECIVFWTKNAGPMVERHWEELLELNKSIPCYFQFSINPYDARLEPNIGDKEKVIECFIKLSKALGRDHMVWRYDPIIFSQSLNIDEKYHLDNYKRLADILTPYTDECIISFVDAYGKTVDNMKPYSLDPISKELQLTFGRQLADIAHSYKLKISACGEPEDLMSAGIERARCIDPVRIAKVTGKCYNAKIKEKNKRTVNGETFYCGCVEHADIGAPNTCKHGCRYCYATINQEQAEKNYNAYDPNSSILVGHLSKDEERKATSREKTLKKVLGD